MNSKTPSKIWTSLNARDYNSIYPVVLENADRHFSCADILAKNDQPQNAIAHLILGSEELIKSFWCLLMSRNVNLKQLPWFTKLFYNHKVRHDLLKDFFSVYLFFFNTTLPKRNKGDGVMKSIQILLSRTINAYGNYSWWKKADELKQQTFYVDYRDGIIDPSSITQTDYKTALNYVTFFKEDIGKLTLKIHGLSDIELQAMIDEFQVFEIDRLRQEAYKKQK
ncbi:AbiV family abortive infection protein [Pedobacter nototheniae]|uniref:AbiV family abortive infection protein n=1 Tax=Pedobacter nototheniae TaxID=2488994 RepID=UPI00103DAC51|nr:AbiV family abortive infection protein [Pedobacter nototheniae]